MENILYIYKSDGSYFPNDMEKAVLSSFEFNAQRMGAAPTITGKIKHTLCLDDLWEKNEYVEFRGERFYVKDVPSSMKDNTDTRYEHDVTFRHERSILDSVFMRDVVFNGAEGTQPEADKYVSNSTKVVFWGNISEFVGRLNACLRSSNLSEYSVVIDEDKISSDLLDAELLVSMEGKYFTEALQEAFNLFKIPYYWVGKVCHFGEANTIGDFVFQYGIENSLLSVEKNNNNSGYCNRATGVGSSENIPYYYPREREPNYTRPHAVEGNRGITDDSTIQYVGVDGKSKFDKLEAVVSEGEPWDGSGIIYDGGSGSADNLVLTDVKMLQLKTYDELLKLFASVNAKGDTDEYEGRFIQALPTILQNEVYLPARLLEGNAVTTDFYTSFEKFRALGNYKHVSPEKMHIDGACNILEDEHIDGMSWYQDFYANCGRNFNYAYQAIAAGAWYKNNRLDTVLNRLVSNFFQSTPFCLSYIYSFTVKGEIDSFDLVCPVGTFHNGIIVPFDEKNIRLYLCDANGNKVEGDFDYSRLVPIEGSTGYDDDKCKILHFRITGMSRYSKSGDLGFKNFNICLVAPLGAYDAFVDFDKYTTMNAEEFDGKATYKTDYIQPFDPEIKDKDDYYDETHQAYLNHYVNDYVEHEGTFEVYHKKPSVNAVSPCWHEIGKLRITDFNRTLADFGISSSQTPVSGDRIVRLLEEGAMNQVPTQQQLMPSIYRGTSGIESFYNALNEESLLKDITYSLYKELYKDENGAYREYENEFFATNPHEAIFEFADIKPTIKGIVNADGKTIDRFVDVAFDDNDHDLTKVDVVGKSDSDDYVPEYGSESEYDHPYFFAKLPRTYISDKEGYSFNLFDSASPETMILSPTKGKCGGCRFTIIVDEETRRNPVLVNEDGSLMRDRNGRVMMAGQNNAKGYGFQDRQQNTKDNEVWICLQKETDTYGILMPNATSNLRPTTDDTFVLLDIYLPVAYIRDAEDRLSKAIIKAMWENNFEKFSFSVNLSRIFVAENRDLFKKIDENSKLNILYDGKTISLPVSSYSYKKDSSSPLPEISVDLNNEVVVSAAYSAANISAVSGGSSALSGNGLPVITSIDNETVPQDTNLMSAKRIHQNYLSKVQDDIVKGFIEFLNGIKVNGNANVDVLFANKDVVVGNFLRGLVGAYSGVDIKPNGDVYARRLYLEDSLVVPTIDFNKAMVLMGIFIVSPACGQIESVSRINETEGWATLKLEDGEYGSIAVGDMLLGFWNSMEGSNKDVDGVWNDEDNIYIRNGNYEFAGCASVYILVTEIDSSNKTNKRFRYQLRSVTDKSWTQGHHPARGMKFFGFGNRDTENHRDRQNVYIITREYSVRLFNKADWTFTQDNIVEISGKLDGFSMNALDRNGNPYVKKFSGTGHVIGNGYFFGTIDQFERAPYIVEQVLYYSATSLVLGKNDYEKVTWVTDADNAKVDKDNIYLYQYWLYTYSDSTEDAPHTEKSDIVRVGNFAFNGTSITIRGSVVRFFDSEEEYDAAVASGDVIVGAYAVNDRTNNVPKLYFYVNSTTTTIEDVSLGDCYINAENGNLLSAGEEEWVDAGNIKGNDITAQYSTTGIEGSWHDVFTDGDLYMRTSLDSGTTWGKAMRIVGETGVAGAHTDYSYGISKDYTTSSSSTAPSIYGSWSDAPVKTTTEYPYLWMKSQRVDGKGNTVGTAVYIRLTGETGADGTQSNLFGYDCEIKDANGVSSPVNTPNGFMCRGTGEGTGNNNHIAVLVSVPNCEYGKKYYISGKLTRPVGGTFYVLWGDWSSAATTVGSDGSFKKLVTANASGDNGNIRFQITPPSETEKYDGLFGISNLKIEDATRLSDATPYDGLAPDGIPQGANMIKATDTFGSPWFVEHGEMDIREKYFMGNNAVYYKGGTTIDSETYLHHNIADQFATDIVKTNRWYSLSFYAKGSGILHVHIRSSQSNKPIVYDGATKLGSGNISCSYNLTSEMTLHTLVFNPDSIDSPYISFSFEGVSNVDGKEVYIAMPKLEEGMKPTAWQLSEADRKGEGNITIDIDNEMDSVPCDSTGKVMSATTISTKVSLYDGSTPLKIEAPNLSVGTLGGKNATKTVNGNDVVVAWQFGTSDSFGAGSDKYIAEVSYSYNGVTYKAVMTMNVVRSGAPGVSPTIYQLRLGSNTVKVSKSGALNPTGFKAFVTKNVGGTITQLADEQISSEGLTVGCEVDGIVKTVTGNVISGYTKDNQKIQVSLNKGGVTIDQEVVPIVADGVDGENAPMTNPNMVLKSNINETFNTYGLPSNRRVTSVKLEAGKTYTFSVNGRIDQTTKDTPTNDCLCVYLYQNNWNDNHPLLIDSIQSETKIVSFVAKYSEVYYINAYYWYNRSASAHQHPSTPEGNVTLNWVKLEEGDVATPWCLAEEDKVGESGVGITGIKEEYAYGTQVDVTGSWGETVLNPTSSNQYVWNREKIAMSDGTTITTNAHIVSRWAADGRGISSVSEQYLSSPSSATPTENSTSWTTLAAAMGNFSETNKYLWNKEVTAYTSGDSTTTIHVIAVYGQKGEDGFDGADAVQPNLFGYGNDIINYSNFKNLCHTYTGIAGYMMNLNTSTWIVININMGDALREGRKYGISFRIKSPYVGKGVAAEFKNASGGNGIGSARFAFSVNTWYDFRCQLTAKSDSSMFVISLEKTNSSDAFSGIFEIQDLKIEDATDLLGTHTMFMGLAESNETVSQNILRDTAYFGNSGDWINYAGRAISNAYKGQTAYFYNGEVESGKYVDFLEQEITGRLKPSTWYTLSYYSRMTKTTNDFYLETYVYEDMADTQSVGVHDGIVGSARGNNWHRVNTASDEPTVWKRHTVTFRTPATLPSMYKVLFRIVNNSSAKNTPDIYICMPKLEENDHATEWQLTNSERVGAIARPCGEWREGATYVWNNYYRDIVIYQNDYYAVKYENTELTSVVPTNTSKWEKANNFRFVATDLLLADKAYINNLGVRDVAVVDADNRAVCDINKEVGVKVYNNSFAICQENGTPMIKAGYDSNGQPALFFYDANGNILYNLGIGGIGAIDYFPQQWTPTTDTLLVTSVSRINASSINADGFPNISNATSMTAYKYNHPYTKNNGSTITYYKPMENANSSRVSISGTPEGENKYYTSKDYTYPTSVDNGGTTGLFSGWLLVRSYPMQVASASGNPIYLWECQKYINGVLQFSRVNIYFSKDALNIWREVDISGKNVSDINSAFKKLV